MSLQDTLLLLRTLLTTSAENSWRMDSDVCQALTPADMDCMYTFIPNSSFQCHKITNRGPRTQANQPTSPFLRLPTELRNTIYKLIFSNTVVEVYPNRSNLRFYDTYRARNGIRSFRKYSGSTARLLYTCRQIRAETHDMFFSMVTFDIRGLDPIDLIHHLGTEQAASIRCIIVDFDTTYNPRDGGSFSWLANTKGKLLGLKRVIVNGYSSAAWAKIPRLDWALNCVSGGRLKARKIKITVN